VRKILTDFFGDKKSNDYDVYAYRPNIDVIEDIDNNYYRFITNRKIKKGEELFIDYNEYSEK
jgi:hypothetical protein